PMRALGTKINRIAVGPRAREAADADVAVSPADVFDDDRLSEGTFHALGNHSRDHVATAAGSKRHDHRDGARRIALRSGDARECWSDCSGPGELQERSALEFHGASPV